jgi:hypothetical protein
MAQTDDQEPDPPWADYARDVHRAEVSLHAFTDILTELVDDMTRDRGKHAGKLPAQAAELATALRRAMEIEERHHAWIAQRRDTLQPGDYDLDAALAEIRRRLDQLRALADAGTPP